MNYPKRLIEVDLPIKRISAHARREKSIRHGHISTLHIWWARRPLAACRAVLCAALWPDPAQEDCPPKFREDAQAIMARFWNPIGRTDLDFSDPMALRKALLDFIADFANWDNSTDQRYLETARALTASAHLALGGSPGTRPLVVDPFAGGGSIPLEALRVGADAFASDLNPVAVLLNKVVLEYIPKYGQTLADEVRKWGEWIRIEAEKELGQFYPKDPDGATPIAYLWARTVTCEGPGCGAEVPLMRSLWLAKKSRRSVALKFIPDQEKKRVDFEIIHDFKAQDVSEGTMRRGSATCPVCGYTTPVASVRKQLKARRGGAADARLFCVVTTKPGQQGRFYRLPTEMDLVAVRKAAEELERRKAAHTGELSLVPDEPTPMGGGSGAGRAFSQRNYGMDLFEDLFTPRQALALTTLASLVREAGRKLAKEHDAGMAGAVQTCLALVVDRQADATSSLCRWHVTGEKHTATFSRQAIPMVWDFSEVNILSASTGGFPGAVEWVSQVCESIALVLSNGHVGQATATTNPLPDDSARLFFTDPPYYDAVPYADLSDFFFVWLKRTLGYLHSTIFNAVLTPKDEECIVDEVKGKDKAYFEAKMGLAMAEGRRILTPDGIGVIVFAHKSTSGWEALLQAMINAGWTFTGSWPIDTEMGSRLRAMDSAALASSIHLVCRPRENPDGSVKEDDVGNWSDVLCELPQRIHAWLPGLAAEGVVGADAIFSCLGPALEIYSRYSRVEKASGEVVLLREYLEEVWAAVSREALGIIFEGVDCLSLEEDARLTAMWLWTLSAGADNGDNSNEGETDEDKSPKSTMKGFVLEYDAARKIAQGLGARMENLTALVEVKGDRARLLPVSERTSYLFGQGSPATGKGRKKKKEEQTTLSGGVAPASERSGPAGELSLPAPGATVLDRLHQAMLLFSNGRSDALKRFIQEDIGQDQGLWSLAQSLSALYPAGSEERRWVEGVLTRKKSLGM
ncbi:MAG: putative methylase [Euryarchaeota archaeon]|nr:putative methylase [Euryarchaeota archaeon]